MPPLMSLRGSFIDGTFRRNGLVDLAKFVMALGVMLGHYHYIMAQEFHGLHMPNAVLAVCHKSLSSFVCVFFFFSGYLAFGRGFDRIHAGGASSVGVFVLDKMRRLFPMLVISIICFVAADFLHLILRGHFWAGRPIRVGELVLSLLGVSRWVGTFGNINGPIWYVSVLLLCLLIFGFVSSMNVDVHYKIGLFGLLAVLGTATIFDDPGLPLFRGKIGRAYMSFFSGVLFAYADRRFLNEIRVWATIFSLALLIAIKLLLYKLVPGNCGTPVDNLIVSAVVVAPLLILIGRLVWVERIFVNPFVKWLGDISFGVFLFHIPSYAAVSCAFGSTIRYDSWWVILSIVMGVVVVSAMADQLQKILFARKQREVFGR